MGELTELSIQYFQLIISLGPINNLTLNFKINVEEIRKLFPTFKKELSTRFGILVTRRHEKGSVALSFQYAITMNKFLLIIWLSSIG